MLRYAWHDILPGHMPLLILLILHMVIHLLLQIPEMFPPWSIFKMNNANRTGRSSIHDTCARPGQLGSFLEYGGARDVVRPSVPLPPNRRPEGGHLQPARPSVRTAMSVARPQQSRAHLRNAGSGSMNSAASCLDPADRAVRRHRAAGRRSAHIAIASTPSPL